MSIDMAADFVLVLAWNVYAEWMTCEYTGSNKTVKEVVFS